MIKNSFTSTTCIVTLLTLSAPALAGTSMGSIQFENSVPNEQADQLSDDYASLAAMNLKQNNAPLMSLLDISSLKSENLIQWLEDRIQVVVGENFDADSQLFTVTGKFSYPNPGLYPVTEVSTAPPSTGKLLTIMSNSDATTMSGEKNVACYWA